MPTLKISPGELAYLVATAPKLSVAVGSVHVIATPVDPNGIVTLMAFGQSLINNLMLSVAAVR